MTKERRRRLTGLAALLLGTATIITGCEEPKGPAEKAGENVDKAVQDAKDAVNPPGPAEKAGRAVDNAVKP